MKQYEVIFEDEMIVAANKLTPMPVQPDKSGDQDLQSLLKAELESRPSFLEAAHRIDRRCSGLVIFAKTPEALRSLEAAFRERKVAKRYVACLEKEPVPPEGTLRHRIASDPKKNRSIALEIKPGFDSARKRKNTVEAELSYSLLMRTDRYFFVEARPLTGRHHQIRAQFAAMGWPIKGDLKYGARRSSPTGRIMLHGRSAEFEHPKSGEPIKLVAPYPQDESLWLLLGEKF
jgi:23S rRNA pseudouridine1911/1915/1917 synthase